MQLCNVCKQEKEVTDFFKTTRSSVGVERQCKKCVQQKRLEAKRLRRETDANWRLKEIEGWRKERERRKLLPDYKRSHQNRNYKSKYGLTIEEVEDRIKARNNLCDICKKEPDNRYKKLYVDHNHETNEVRGMLCHYCNFAIGLLKEDPHLLQEALQYLKKYT
jgi:hypothetical protein